jgi:hypothetical protein
MVTNCATFQKKTKTKKGKNPGSQGGKQRQFLKMKKKNTMWQIGQANSPVVCQLKNGLTH